jgi:hypothetical protein
LPGDACARESSTAADNGPISHSTPSRGGVTGQSGWPSRASSGAHRVAAFATNFRIGTHTRRNRSSVSRGWPCGQNTQPKPECHQQRFQRYEAGGGVTGFDCGAGDVLLGATPPAGARVLLKSRSEVLALFCRAAQIEGQEGMRPMTRTRDNQAARRLGESARDRGSRAFDRAIQARRRLNTPAGESQRNESA